MGSNEKNKDWLRCKKKITVTAQGSGYMMSLRVHKVKPKGCSAVRQICLVCKTTSIPKKSKYFDNKICPSCLSNAHPGCSLPAFGASSANPSGSAVNHLNKSDHPLDVKKENPSEQKQNIRVRSIRLGKIPNKGSLHTMPEDLNEMFETALKMTAKDSKHYAAVWSIRRQFLLKGWLSSKQRHYLSDLATGSTVKRMRAG